MSNVAELDFRATPLAGQVPDEAVFVLLCAAELSERYMKVVAAAGHHGRVVHTIEALLGECVQRPPAGILLDMNAMTRLGAMATAPLFELDIDWPILRCTLLGDGGANFMSVDPMQFGALGKALGEIAAGDACWGRQGRHRRAIRLDVACRMAVRRNEHAPWIAANCLDISVGGLFAVSYESFKPSERIEMQLRDLSAAPIPLAGRIVRARRWEDSTELPGIAVQFEPECVSADFRRLLAGPEMIQNLIRRCHKQTLPAGALLDHDAVDDDDLPQFGHPSAD